MLEFEDVHASKVFGSDFAPYTSSPLSTIPKAESHFPKFSAPREISALAIICGDIVHNPQNSPRTLCGDELTVADSIVPPHMIKFPVYPTRKHLEDFIASREEQKSIVALSGKVLDMIKPYKRGNLIGDSIYALHRLDVRDKHRLLIPQVQVSHVGELDTEDRTNEKILYGPDLINTFGAKDRYQGKLSASMIFGEDAEPVEGQPIIQTLRAFETAVEVA